MKVKLNYAMICYMIIFLPLTIHAKEAKKIFLQTGHSDTVYSICFSPDGRLLASGSRDKTIKLWNTNDGALIRTFTGHSDFVMSVSFSPDGSRIASGDYDDMIKLWNIKDGALIRTFKGHSNVVESVSFSSDGSQIVSGSCDATIKLWDVKAGTLIRIFEGHSSSVYSVSFNPDGSRIASGSFDKTIKLWDVEDGALIRTFNGHSSIVYSVIFSPDGSRIASGSRDDTIKLWDVKTGNLIRTFEGHSSLVYSVSFSPDGGRIASGSWDNTIKLWDVKDGALIRTFKGHSYSVNSVSFSPDGSRIASGSSDNTIKLWDVKDGTLIRTLKEHSPIVEAVNFSPDGSRIASESSDNTIKLWDVKDGALIRTLKRNSSDNFSPNLNWIVSASSRHKINLWNINDGALIRALKEHPRILEYLSRNSMKDLRPYLKLVSVSPDGNLIAFQQRATFPVSMMLCNVKKGVLVRNFEKNISDKRSVRFSPDSSRIAFGSYSNTIKLLNVNGTLIRSFEGHSDDVISVSFSPDGSRIASGSEDKTIKLWNIKDGSLIRTFKGHSDDVISVNFSPDGRRIVSGSKDNTIRLWNINNENDFYTYALLPENEWISFKPGQLYYNSSSNGDKYAAIRFNNNTFHYEPLSNYRNKYKIVKGLFQSEPYGIDNKNLNIQLQCKHEGRIKNSYDIDEEIVIYSECPDRRSKINYSENLKVFTKKPQCSKGKIDIDPYKFEKQTLYFNPNNKNFLVEMKFKKPILYVLIHPGNPLNKFPLNYNTDYFNKFKDQLRLLSDRLDGNHRYWKGVWERAYFFTQNAENEPIWLCNQGNIATKWTDPDLIETYNSKIQFHNQTMTYDQLIDDACQFLNGFSISDQLSFRGMALIIIGAPENTISQSQLKKLEQKLRNNKVCALIVQFGKSKHDFTEDTTLFKQLKLIQFNLEKEFLNKYFQDAFEYIMKEFTLLYDNNQVKQ
jgi:WD40 repeat protein